MKIRPTYQKRAYYGSSPQRESRKFSSCYLEGQLLQESVRCRGFRNPTKFPLVAEQDGQQWGGCGQASDRLGGCGQPSSEMRGKFLNSSLRVPGLLLKVCVLPEGRVLGAQQLCGAREALPPRSRSVSVKRGWGGCPGLSTRPSRGHTGFHLQHAPQGCSRCPAPISFRTFSPPPPPAVTLPSRPCLENHKPSLGGSADFTPMESCSLRSFVTNNTFLSSFGASKDQMR